MAWRTCAGCCSTPTSFCLSIDFVVSSVCFADTRHSAIRFRTASLWKPFRHKQRSPCKTPEDQNGTWSTRSKTEWTSAVLDRSSVRHVRHSMVAKAVPLMKSMNWNVNFTLSYRRIIATSCLARVEMPGVCFTVGVTRSRRFLKCRKWDENCLPLQISLCPLTPSYS